MTGIACPEMMAAVCAAHAAADVEHAHDMFDACLPWARCEQQPGIGLAVRQHLMVQRGAITSAMVRKPGPASSAADVAAIAHRVRRQEGRLHERGLAD